jgi:hypothetical protein
MFRSILNEEMKRINTTAPTIDELERLFDYLSN